MTWTNEKLVKLRELCVAGRTNAEIAEYFDIPVEQVYTARSHHNLTISKVSQPPHDYACDCCERYIDYEPQAMEMADGSERFFCRKCVAVCDYLRAFEVEAEANAD